MTSKEIYTKMRIEDTKGCAYYIGFISKKKYNLIKKEVENFKEIADLDFDLGVLEFRSYQKEITKYNLMIKSLETAEIM